MINALGVDPSGRHNNEIESLHVLQKIRKTKDAIAFFSTILAHREQASKPPPSGAILRIGQNVGRAIAEDQARAYRDLYSNSFCYRMRPYDARNGIAISDADTDETKFFGA